MESTRRMRYSDAELAEFKALIEVKLHRSMEELDFYNGQLADMADNPDSKVKALDDGTGSEETERVNAMAARTRKHIQHLENALLRIENKSYGICRETGQLISKARLRAVPHATLCIEAKKAR